MMQEDFSKNDNVGYKIRLLHNQLQKHMEYQRAKNEYDCGDLTRMQVFTLRFLHRNSDRDIYQKDLEAAFSISRATASNMLAVMERKGLIKREPVAHDARLKKVVPTEKACMLHTQVKHDIMLTEEMLTKGLDVDDIKRLHQYLDLMLQNIVVNEGEDTTISSEKNNK